MAARNRTGYIVADLSRDTGFSSATIFIDPSKWSGRRRNIVVGALKNGLTSCGQETAYFIECLTEAYGGRVQTLTQNQNHIETSAVKDDEVDNLIAYTCAWIRIMFSTEMQTYHNGHLSNWLNFAKDGRRPSTIPAPKISGAEQVAFIKQYLKDDDYTTKSLRVKLVHMIEQGEMLSINVKASAA